MTSARAPGGRAVSHARAGQTWWPHVRRMDGRDGRAALGIDEGGLFARAHHGVYAAKYASIGLLPE